MRFKILLITSFFVFSCESNIEYIQYNSIENQWDKDSIQNFVFELADTKKYNTYINLRINKDYPFSNIFLITTLMDSLSVLSKDTLNFKIADKSGKFLGKKRVNIIENSLIHKEKIELEKNKKYSVSIEHAMRVINKVSGLKSLDGVVDVGYKIENIN
jgi:gliding motility-associated lipoprotein GldH